MVRSKSLFYNESAHPPLHIQEDAAEERKKADKINEPLLNKVCIVWLLCEFDCCVKCVFAVVRRPKDKKKENRKVF